MPKNRRISIALIHQINAWFQQFITSQGSQPSLLLDFAGDTYGIKTSTLLGQNIFSNLLTFTRGSTATFFDASGVMQTAAVDEPRLDHDPATGAALGLLIEESRTNLFTYSEQFDNAAWGKFNCSVAANASASPDGNSGMDKIVEDTTATSGHRVYRTVTGIADNTEISFTIRLKPAERNWVKVTLRAKNNSYPAVYFDVANSVVGTVSGNVLDYSIKDIGGGISEVFVSASSLSGAYDVQVFVELATGDGTNSYTGDGTSGLYVWGAQLEAGAFPTSYIPTTGAAVTRAADVCYRTLGAEYNAAEGTVVCELTPSSYSTSCSGWQLTNDVNNRALFQATNGGGATRHLVFIAGSPTGILDVAVASGGIKDAWALKTNDLASSTNGAAAITDTTSNIPMPTLLDIGRAGASGGDYLNGHIKSLVYYPARLTDAELQELTA